MRTSKRGIAFRLSVFIFGATFLIFLALVYVNYRVARQQAIENARLTSYKLLEDVLNQIDRHLLEVQYKAEKIARVIEIQQPSSPGEIKKILKGHLALSTWVDGSALIFDKKREEDLVVSLAYFYNKEKDTLFNLAKYYPSFKEEKWFKISMKAEAPFWSQQHMSIINPKKRFFTYSIPLKNEGEWLGVLTEDIPVDKLNNLISSFRVFNSGFALLVSRRGNILTTFTTKNTSKINLADIKNSKNEEVVQNLLRSIANREPYMGYLKKSLVTGNQVYLLAHPLKYIQASLLISLPKKEVLAKLYHLSLMLILIALAGMILLGITVFIIIRKMLASLKNLSHFLDRIGSGDFDIPVPEPKRMDEIGRLSLSFIQMQNNLKKKTRLLNQSISDMEEIESEVSFAARIQRSILPQKVPEVLVQSGIDIFGVLQPAEIMGGDLYDYFMLDSHRICFLIGDVTGKGIPASFFMSMVRTFFRAEAKHSKSAGELVQKVNFELSQNNPESIFVTAFCCILDTKTFQVDFCNAGHNYPVKVSKSGKITEITRQHGTDRKSVV